jgi:hypothetical protein
MLYEITYDDQTAIVHVRVSGSAPPDDHQAARMEAAQLCCDKNCPRLLVDLRRLIIDKSISTLSGFNFGAGYQDIVFPQATRIAHVMPTDNKAFELVDFIATVALNRGVLIRNFRTVREAVKWLHEGMS